MTRSLQRRPGARKVRASLPLASVPFWNHTHPVRWRDVGRLDCTIARTLSVIGDRWTLLILRDAFLGIRRFEDFQRDLDVSRHRLADRLGKLVKHGVLRRERYQMRPARWEYRLTDKGRDVYPVLAAMAAWGDRWLIGPEGTPLVLHHTACDHDMHAVVVCSECDEPLDVRQVRAKAGPGYPTSDGPAPS